MGIRRALMNTDCGHVHETNLKMSRMKRLEISQERIATRLGQARETIRHHLAKMKGVNFRKWEVKGRSAKESGKRGERK